MKEEWKDIKGFEGWYQVSNKGRVRSMDRYINHCSGGLRFAKGKVLAFSIRSGYYVACMNVNGSQSGNSVHRFVAETFIPNPDKKVCVNHKDGNKLNNCVDNLEWATYSENHIHARKNGLIKNFGENHHSSKLTKKDIPNIIEMSKTGIDVKNIAQEFKVTIGSIYNIINGKTWKHIPR